MRFALAVSVGSLAAGVVCEICTGCFCWFTGGGCGV